MKRIGQKKNITCPKYFKIENYILNNAFTFSNDLSKQPPAKTYSPSSTRGKKKKKQMICTEIKGYVHSCLKIYKFIYVYIYV